MSEIEQNTEIGNQSLLRKIWYGLLHLWRIFAAIAIIIGFVVGVVELNQLLWPYDLQKEVGTPPKTRDPTGSAGFGEKEGLRPEHLFGVWRVIFDDVILSGCFKDKGDWVLGEFFGSAEKSHLWMSLNASDSTRFTYRYSTEGNAKHIGLLRVTQVDEFKMLTLDERSREVRFTRVRADCPWS